METNTEKETSPTEKAEKKADDSAAGGTTVTSNLQNQAIIEKLREIDTRTKETERKLAETAEKVPEKTLDEKTKIFFNDPTGVIQDMLNKTVKPLIEFRDEVKAGTAYDRIKAEYKNDPRFKEFMARPGIEAHVDKMMEKNEPTRDSMLGVLLGLRGGIELGLVPKPEGYDSKKEDNKEDNKEPDTEKKESKVRSEIPPHLRPSSAPSPRGGEAESQLRELSESEERLRIENKLTKREYIELTDEVGPAEVVGWKTESERKKAEAK